VRLVSELLFGVVHPEVGVNAQLHIAFRTFVPGSTVLLLGGRHVTLHAFFFLWLVLTTMHFQMAGGWGLSYLWVGLALNHPSTLLY